MIIEALDAANGDATIVRHVNPKGEQIVGLVDGGPGSTLGRAIEPALAKCGVTKTEGRLNWLAVSHVDSDHIGGVLRLVIGGFTVEQFLYNTPFTFPESNVAPAAIGGGDGIALERRLADLVRSIPPDVEVASIPQGTDLLNLILGPGRGADWLNPPLYRRLLTGDTLDIEGLKVSVVAPSQPRIDALLKAWEYEAPAGAGVRAASSEQMDNSVTNLSSLAFIVDVDDRTALFTGDALEDDLVAGLEQAGYKLPMCVNLLKVPHHGSNSAASQKSLDDDRGLIENVRADHYIVSANGTSTNPSLSTLRRIVEAQSSPCTIWLPSPRPLGDSKAATHYKDVLDSLANLVEGADPKVTVRVGTGDPLIIDLN